jgi:hypothetical protein
MGANGIEAGFGKLRTKFLHATRARGFNQGVDRGSEMKRKSENDRQESNR